jgi:hypothetical protein
MNKALKYTLISLPILVGGGIVYWQIRKYHVPAKKAIPQTNLNTDTGGVVVPTNNGCDFPLQKGVYNNPCVGQLQTALGIGIDNDFGSKTLTALQAQTGLSLINDFANLQQVISDLNSVKGSASVVDKNILLANGILDNYNSFLNQFGFKYIRTIKPTVWDEVTYNPFVFRYLSAGYQITLPAYKNMSINDYQPYSVDENDGYLIIKCNKGGNAGLWKANPNDIELF